MSNRVSNALVVMMFVVLTACSSNGGTRSQYVAKDAKAADINMRLGLNYMQRGDYKIALEKLEKALKQNPNLPSAHNTIALLYQRLDENEKAEEHFEKAIQQEPDYSEAQNNYGVFLCQQGRYDEAEKRFLKAVENPLYSSAPLAYENAGLCTAKGGAIDRAEGYFRKALQMVPGLPKSLLQMADISYQQQNYLQARAYIQRFQQAANWTPQALLLGIRVETKLADKNAVSSYKLIMRSRFPDSDEMRIVNQGLVE
ncbi:type IV pilus biogenesis/stability protein PilW [Methylophaga sp.]|uniref:type IV pilus biogenesis/stability protein PilW n=1 Tax=Methylophaga sp. TaxID=2024840 RepID=UPI003A93D436